MTPRITPLTSGEVSETIRQVYAAHEARSGYVSPVLKVLAHRQEYVDFYDAAMRVQSVTDSTVSPLDRFLIQAKVAVATRSPYAMKYFQHKNEVDGLLPANKFEALLREGDAGDLFDERERCVIALGERLGNNGLVDEALWTGLLKHYSETELLDLLVVGSVESFYATFVRGLGLTSVDLPA